MAYEWQTVESAAVTLGISTRTLARRISEGKIESRLENGRREVFVCLPDPEPAPAPPQAMPHQTMPQAAPEAPGRDGDAGQAQPYAHAFGPGFGPYPQPYAPGYNLPAHAPQHGGHALAPHADPALTHQLVLAEDRLTLAQQQVRSAELTVSAFRQSADMAYNEVRRAKHGAMWAWGTVAVLAAGVVVVTGWTTASVTRSQSRTEFLEQRITEVKSEHERAVAKQDGLRQQAEEARIAAAEAKGQLQAYQQQQEAQRQAAEREAIRRETAAREAAVREAAIREASRDAQARDSQARPAADRQAAEKPAPKAPAGNVASLYEEQKNGR